MGRDIPYISEEMMASVERIFAHGKSRAKNHDQRLGQWLVNKIYQEHGCDSSECLRRFLSSVENQELWDILKGYNE